MVINDNELTPQFSLKCLIRPNILSLTPYRCARDDYDRGILLDANENSLGSALSPVTNQEPEHSELSGREPKPENAENLNLRTLSLHRYPSPSQIPIKRNLCEYKNSIESDLPLLEPSNVFLGVGSDEILDLIFRITCKPGHSEDAGDQVIITPPTYGMYSVCAKVNDVGIINVPLDVQDGAFTVDLDQIDKRLTQQSSTRPIKLIILCSPGNPTGTTIPIETIRKILSNSKFKGLLVVDEAYIDFAGNFKSAIQLIRSGWKNLIVTQTLSKAFGLAGIRLGVAYGSKDLIQILNNTKAPYTISSPTSALGYRATQMEVLKKMELQIQEIIKNREWLKEELSKIDGLGKILGKTEANFILIQVLSSQNSQSSLAEGVNGTSKFGSSGSGDNDRAKKVYKAMAENSLVNNSNDHGVPIVVRYRGDEFGCQSCLRITVGSRLECQKLIQKLDETLRLIP